MFARTIVALLLTACSVTAFAQEKSGTVRRWPTKGSDTSSAPAPQPAPQRTAEPRRQPEPRPSPSPARAEAAPPAPAERAAEPRREPSETERAAQRVAVPRTRPLPRDIDRDRDVIVAYPGAYYPRYYYPRAVYPYGYGAFGLGYFYYNPYGWYPSASLNYYGGGAGPGYWGYGSGYDIGELRLRVTPRDAQVFIDGAYAGTVDDFDGMFQAVRLESGPYHVELRLPGYETLDFDVRVTPGQKVTYRGDLKRVP